MRKAMWWFVAAAAAATVLVACSGLTPEKIEATRQVVAVLVQQGLITQAQADAFLEALRFIGAEGELQRWLDRIGTLVGSVAVSLGLVRATRGASHKDVVPTLQATVQALMSGATSKTAEAAQKV